MQRLTLNPQPKAAPAVDVGNRNQGAAFELATKGPRVAPGPLQYRPLSRTIPVAQMKVQINRTRPYDRNEQIVDFDYHRTGSAGGNHFVSDLLIRNIIGEMVVGKIRDNAKKMLMNFWAATGFRGTLTIAESDTAAYDDSVDSLISEVSNQPSNRFDGAGSGDDRGRKIDVPQTPSGQSTVAGYASKLYNALSAVSGDLGSIGKNVRTQLKEFC
jgi:hypothetical protein